MCIAKSAKIARGATDEEHTEIIKTLMKKQRARVVICFCDGETVRSLYNATTMVPGAKNHFLVVGRYSIIHGVNIYLYICTCVFYVRPFCGVIDWDSGILGGGVLYFLLTLMVYIFPSVFQNFRRSSGWCRIHTRNSLY